MMLVLILMVCRYQSTIFRPEKKRRFSSTRRESSSVKDYELIIRDDLSFTAQSIYRYLRYRQGKNENCYPSHKTIAADNKCSVSTVKRAIAELIKAGYIEKVNRRRSNGAKTSNIYIYK